MQILNRFKELLDAYPKNTSEAKKLLSETHGLNPRKIQRWYKDSKMKISVNDAIALKEFFGLNTIDDLYTVKSNKKPIKAFK